MSVKIYTTNFCPYCSLAKDWMKKHNISFEEINVQKNPDRGEEMIKKSGQTSVPVIEVNGKIIIGFNKPELAKALNIKE